MLKKVLSLGLITLFLFQAVQLNLCTSYALWGFGSANKAKQEVEDPCKLKDEDIDYKFKNVVEAIDCGVKSLKRGDRSFSSTDMGPKNNTDLWMWDYIQIGTVGGSLQDEIKKNKKNIIDEKVIIKIVDTFKTLFKDNDVVSEEVVNTWLNMTKFLNLSKIEKMTGESTVRVNGTEQAGNIKGLAKNRGYLFGALGFIAGAAITAFIPVVGTYTGLAYLASLAGGGVVAGGVGGAAGYLGGAEMEVINDVKKRNEIIQKKYTKINCYAMAIEKILEGLAKELWKSGDVLYLDINHDIKNYKVEAKFLDKGIYYTKEDRKNFEKAFKALEADLLDKAANNKNDEEEL